MEIVALITVVAICDDCLARKTGLPPRRVADVLNEIASTLKLTTTPGRCASCLKQTIVHRVG
jgi:hypothetical protein